MSVNNTSSGETLLHAKQVADILKLQLGTVYELARNGTLPSIRIGTRIVRFRRTTLDQWLAERESDGGIAN